MVIIPMFWGEMDNLCYYVHPQGDMSQGFYIDVA